MLLFEDEAVSGDVLLDDRVNTNSPRSLFITSPSPRWSVMRSTGFFHHKSILSYAAPAQAQSNNTK